MSLETTSRTCCPLFEPDVSTGAHESSPVSQDILKGSGKLVDSHTVKYSLPGESHQNPIMQTELSQAEHNSPCRHRRESCRK